MLGRIRCTCRAARLPWRSFLGRSAAALHLDSTCREIFWDAVASLVGFGAPNNYFASFSVGRTDCICLVEFFARAQLPTSPCVLSWDAVASLFIVARLTTTSAAFPLAEQIVYAWDFGCITSHAQSTAATYFICAVRSVVVHLIVVCWVLLLQSSGADQIGQTRWPTELFALACVEINSKSTFFVCNPSTNKAYIADTACASPKCFAFTQLIKVHFCVGFGSEQCCVVRLLSWYVGRSCCSISELNRLVTLGGQQKYLLMPA